MEIRASLQELSIRIQKCDKTDDDAEVMIPMYRLIMLRRQHNKTGVICAQGIYRYMSKVMDNMYLLT